MECKGASMYETDLAFVSNLYLSPGIVFDQYIHN